MFLADRKDKNSGVNVLKAQGVNRGRKHYTLHSTGGMPVNVSFELRSSGPHVPESLLGSGCAFLGILEDVIQKERFLSSRFIIRTSHSS